MMPDAECVFSHLADCPKCRSAMSELRAMLDEAQSGPPRPGLTAESRVVDAIGRAVARVARPARSSHRARWAAAAAVLLASVTGLIEFGSGFRKANAEAIVATVIKTDGRVVVHRGGAERPAVAGMGLHEGDQVAVPAEATAILDLPDASRAELGPESSLTFHQSGGADSLELEGGFLAVDASVRPPGHPLSIRTPDARAEVLGTRFTMGVNPEETHLRVSEGLVHLIRIDDGASVDVAGGHRSEVSGGRVDLQSRPSLPGTVLIIASHDQAPPHFERFDRLVGERLLGRRLRHLGFRVETKRHQEVRAADLVGRPLVIVSYSEERVGYEQSLERIGLKTAEVPVLCFEPMVFPTLGMTGTRRGADFDWLGGQGPVELTDPGHPLSGGLIGTRSDLFEKGDLIGWARPGREALKIAVLPGDGSQAVVFAYEAGAGMVEAQALRRRVGLFLDPARVGEGSETAWTLVEAAVEWCVEPPRGDPSVSTGATR